jgi:tetratricopeptide (TPR) repeat protein
MTVDKLLHEVPIPDGDGDVNKIRGDITAWRRSLDSIERVLYHSPDDAVVLVRHLHERLSSLLPTIAKDESLVISYESLETDLRKVNILIQGVPNVATLEQAAGMLRLSLRQFEKTHTLNIYHAWKNRLSPRRVYLICVSLLFIVAAALTVNESVLSYNLERFDERYIQGNELLYEGRYSEAVQVYREALEILPHHPKSASVYNNLGWALQQMNLLDESITSYQSAIELDENFDLARNNLAAVLRLKNINK